MKKNSTRLEKILRFIPGFLTWTTLSSPLWLGFLWPKGVVFALTFLALFWVYRAVAHSVGVALGYGKYRREIKVNWLKKCQKLPEFENLKHLILIPFVDAEYTVTRHTLKGIVDNNYSKESVFVAITCEERGAEKVRKDVERLKKEFGSKLGKEVLFFTHPAGIAGEAIGAGAANRAWGAKHAVAYLKGKGYHLNDFLFTTFDDDAKIHKQYLARLSHKFLTAQNRNNKFYYPAVFLYDNNIWNVPPLMRIQANSVTLAVLSSAIIEPHRKDTWSAYSVTLNTLIEADYWDTSLGVDDTPFFWRAFFAKNGDFEGEGFFIPIYSDAVQGKDFLHSHTSQYKQLLRWGWGVIVFPLAMEGFLKNKAVPPLKKFMGVIYMLEQYTIWRTITFLITFGFGLLTVFNQAARQNALIYTVPDITGWILTGAIFFLLPITIFREKLVAKKPRHWPWWKKLWSYAEGPLVIINLLTFAFIPYLDAQTRFMFGKKMKDLYFTPKIRS
ncbi:MAG: hypothetical protein ABH814_01300 [bacterium]